MKSDLISKRALIKFIDKTVVPELLLHDNASGAGVMAGLSKVLEETGVIPTIDAVPVVHGRWDWLIDGYYCSECDHKIRKLKRKPNYCERCGAKMDGGGDNA